MQPEALKLLQDVISAADSICKFTDGMDLPAYKSNEMCRAAVERKFEVIGEACTRLRDKLPDVFAKLQHGPQIIGLRNRVIHGYDDVDDAILWDAITSHLPRLVEQIRSITR